MHLRSPRYGDTSYSIHILEEKDLYGEAMPIKISL
jgi:hypothetical protein